MTGSGTTTTTEDEAGRLYARDRVIAGTEKLRFFPLAVTRGHGSTLVEAGGRELLDLSATWTASALGHGHPAVREAIVRVAGAPAGASVLSATHPAAVELAERLLALTPGDGERRVYLGHAGSDANDVAIRCARHATGRRAVLAFDGSYHGGLGVAMQASGVHASSGTTDSGPDVVFTPYPDTYRAADDTARRLERVTELLRTHRFACLLAEPVLSDGGLVVPPDGFLAELAHECAASGTVLVVDEVKAGLGRAGTLHAFEHDSITPDVVTYGKALGGGLPLSAVVGPATVLDEPRAGALLTTAGNPYSCAAGLAVLDTLDREGLVERSAVAGARLREALVAVTADLDCVGEVRGRGLMIGVDLVADRQGKQPAPSLAAKAAYRLWELGAVAYPVGASVIEVTPPLVVTDEEVDRGAELLARAVRDAAAGAVPDEAVAAYAGW